MRLTHEKIILSGMELAAQMWETDARNMRTSGNSRLAEQFDRQAAEAREVIGLIENGQTASL